MNNDAIYKKITDKILSVLATGTIPWHKPWTSHDPRNGMSGRLYRGFNRFWLGFQQSQQKYESPFWFTFNQIKGLGGHVKAGQKCSDVILWFFPSKPQTPSEDSPEDSDGTLDNAKGRPWLKTFQVFNLSQCQIAPDKLPKHVREWRTKQTNNDPIQVCEDMMTGYADAPAIEFGGFRAAYSPMSDKIMMPLRASFDSSEKYYSTLFHEAVHSSGHESRLSRDGVAKRAHAFGSQEYSKEEMVAEMGAAMLCGITGIENKTVDNSAAYVAGWLKKLGSDPKLVVIAAQQAQKAADWIQGIK